MSTKTLSFLILLAGALGGVWLYQYYSEDASEIETTSNANMLERDSQYEVSTSDVQYHADTSGFFARPADDGAYPGVVMIHEWWGLNDNIKDMARQLAGEGYIVLAVDLFGSVAQTPEEARAQTNSLDQAEAIGNMNAAISYMRERGATSLASLGWCFGGGQSLQFALARGTSANNTPPLALDATVIYYGSLVTDEARLTNVEWPVLGIFGEEDSSIPVDTVRMFDTTLDALGTPNEIYIYPDVGHAFANPSGTNYAPKETVDAWEKTLAFLNTHLKQKTPAP